MESILECERSIEDADEDRKRKAEELLVSFLMSFASRTATRERLSIFTTNYDRLIEYGSDLAGLHVIDRFVGALSPLFRSSRLSVDIHYNPPGIRGGTALPRRRGSAQQAARIAGLALGR